MTVNVGSATRTRRKKREREIPTFTFGHLSTHPPLHTYARMHKIRKSATRTGLKARAKIRRKGIAKSTYFRIPWLKCEHNYICI